MSPAFSSSSESSESESRVMGLPATPAPLLSKFCSFEVPAVITTLNSSPSSSSSSFISSPIACHSPFDSVTLTFLIAGLVSSSIFLVNGSNSSS